MGETEMGVLGRALDGEHPQVRVIGVALGRGHQAVADVRGEVVRHALTRWRVRDQIGHTTSRRLTACWKQTNTQASASTTATAAVTRTTAPRVKAPTRSAASTKRFI